MGEYVVGTILGMGSQGDMGTHHHAGICAIDSLALAKEQITNHQQPITNHLPYPLYCRLPLRPVHLFWSELLLLRSAFVCLIRSELHQRWPRHHPPRHRRTLVPYNIILASLRVGVFLLKIPQNA